VEFRHQTLPNGLEVIAECNARAYSCGYAFFVNTGSRDETDALSGVSHFLEHMTFKGTPTRTAEQVNRELDEIGSQSNAYTSEEQTVYYATVLPEYQQRTVELLSDIMRPSLRDDDFEVEKKVIIEEIHKYDDQPPYGAYEKCMAAYFGEHTLGRSILGTVDTVSALTPEAMRGYFERRYSPSNLTLVAAGNVDFDALVAEAEKRCGDWVPADSGRETPAVKPASQLVSMQKDSAVQQYAVQIVGAPAAEDQQRYASR
jgi:predicted Zn-dependent peptidase